MFSKFNAKHIPEKSPSRYVMFYCLSAIKRNPFKIRYFGCLRCAKQIHMTFTWKINYNSYTTRLKIFKKISTLIDICIIVKSKGSKKSIRQQFSTTFWVGISIFQRRRHTNNPTKYDVSHWHSILIRNKSYTYSPGSIFLNFPHTAF